LHGTVHERRDRRGSQGGQGCCGHEDHGQRVPPPAARQRGAGETQARRRHARRAQVGSEKPQRPHHRPEHDRHGPVGREHAGIRPAVRRGRRKTPGPATGPYPPHVLPHVRRMRRPVPPGPAGGRCAALPHLRRWLRPVRPGARAIPAIGRRPYRGPLHRVPRLHRPMPLRRARGPTPHPRTGSVRMLKLVCGAGLFAGLLAAANPACNLVPGWTPQGDPRSFAADNLFEYMDGNAEGYLLYGFRNMHGVTCLKGGVTLVIDISDFGDADSAYGMFCANRDLRQPPAKLGMGGQIVPRKAIFAKGPYYVEVAAEPEGDHTATLQAWTAALEKIAPGTNDPPVALSWR